MPRGTDIQPAGNQQGSSLGGPTRRVWFSRGGPGEGVGRVRKGRNLRFGLRAVRGRAPVQCEVTTKQAKPGVCSGGTPSQSENRARGSGRKSAESGRKSVEKR